ncbi:hypothetical protein MSA03_15280 [Microbacterium saccharophilum]|nr:hypothetical protein MSA03_15280 [Microbacterium saccharophilum]
MTSFQGPLPGNPTQMSPTSAADPDDEIVGWVVARTGPGAGILFLIATYLWGVAAVLGIVAIIAALAASQAHHSSPPPACTASPPS